MVRAQGVGPTHPLLVEMLLDERLARLRVDDADDALSKVVRDDGEQVLDRGAERELDDLVEPGRVDDAHRLVHALGQAVARDRPHLDLAILAGSDNLELAGDLDRVEREVDELGPDLERLHVADERHAALCLAGVHGDAAARSRHGEEEEARGGEQERELGRVRRRDVVQVVVRRDQGRAAAEEVSRPARQGGRRLRRRRGRRAGLRDGGGGGRGGVG